MVGMVMMPNVGRGVHAQSSPHKDAVVGIRVLLTK